MLQITKLQAKKLKKSKGFTQSIATIKTSAPKLEENQREVYNYSQQKVKCKKGRNFGQVGETKEYAINMLLVKN